MQGPAQYIANARARKEQDRRDPYELMFPKQREAFAAEDQEFIAVHCGRRSGKTRGFLLRALKVMQKYPGCRVPYIALTRKSAEGILWRQIAEVNDDLGLGLIPRKGALVWEAPNGAEIFLVGANKTDEIEKLRGQAYPLIGIDEAASFRATLLELLIDDVLDMALMDYKGSIILVGTPGAACVGYFHDVCTGAKPGWSVHHWDATDNPHMPHAAEWMEARRIKRGWDTDNPTYLREYRGIWARDTDALVYKWDQSRNGEHAMPDDYDPASKAWSHVIGIDYGYVDSCAWVVLAFRSWKGSGGDRTVYVVESFKRSTLSLEEHAEFLSDMAIEGVAVEADRPVGAGLLQDEAGWLTQRLYRKYAPQRIVGDSGGLGKPYVEFARRRLKIPIVAADKAAKLAQIEFVNAALRTSALRVILTSNRDLIDEAAILQWSMEKVAVTAGGQVRHELRRAIDERFEDHLCDALQYAYGAATAYRNEAPAKKPPRDLSRDAVDDTRDAPRERRNEAGWLETRRAGKQANDWWDR
jgi:hypothetical protein|tara:strand:+ start:2585 stop:4165 length:1581 start_codon:yes stop_codon:yes gene_type:complete